MIEYTQGDILKSDTEALVNAVNLVGVMGKGLALQFKKAYPEMFTEYQRLCKGRELKPGRMHVFQLSNNSDPKYIINFPTKRHFRAKSKYEDIDSGLTDLRSVIEQKHISSISIPPLGCGLGGLDWERVRPMMVEKLRDLDDVRVLVYESQFSPR